jgi:formiminoglutamase
MSWESRYLPPNPAVWHGRPDTPEEACFYQHMRLLNLFTQKPENTKEIAFALVGFKCDEGVQRDLGRTGAFEGPIAIRQRLAKLPIQKPDIICYDAGDIVCTDHDLEASQMALAEVVAMLLRENIRPIVLGGGHEVAWGQYQGIAMVYPPEKRLGILNIDAHFDLQPLKPTHRGSATTAFYQIAEAHEESKRKFDYNCIGIQHAGNIRQSFDIAKQFNTRFILADDLHQGQQEKCIDFTDRVIDENQLIYMSMSLDVFSPAFAPGVGTIQPLGLYPWHIIPLMRQLAASGKVICYDIVEHVPRYDIDHRTAKLAASLIYEIIHHHNDHPNP